MLKLIFAFDHINYTRFNSFQYVFLSNLSKDNQQAWCDILKYGFGATSSGEIFSEFCGDFVTEYFNKKYKGKAELINQDTPLIIMRIANVL